MSFDYDTVMADPDSHVFTNVNPKEDIQSEYDYMYDDFGSQVLPDDLVMKVVFKKREINKDCLTTITFDRWFEKNDFPNIFKKSAQQGYSGYCIELRRTTPLSERDEYLNRRLRDPRTVVRLKEKLPGIRVEFVKEQATGPFRLRYTTEKMEFSWKQEDGE